MKTALLICDPNWSTGNIAKCLQATLFDWAIELHDWSLPLPETDHDAVVSMSMTGPARNPSWCTPRIASVLCGPGEMALPEVEALQLPSGIVLAGVSGECAELLRGAYPNMHSIHVTSGFAHPDLFTFKRRQDTPIRRAGFVGHPVALNMQVSGSAKRPEMFREICVRAGVEPVFTEARYSYKDMSQFYDWIDVLISTSAHEGGPFSPMEAIACGVPALSTNVGVIRDMALPGTFDTVDECVALVAGARGLLAEQLRITRTHRRISIAAWNSFLHTAAAVRAQTA